MLFMKKTLSFILAVVFVASCLAACAADKNDTEGTATKPVTEIVTDESGEAETEVVTNESGKEVTKTVTEKVTKADGTVETVTKTVPVTKAVTKISSKSSTTVKKSSGSSSSKTSTTKKKSTTAKSSSQSKATTAKATTKKSTAKATKKATTAKATTKHTHKWVAQTKTETTYKWEQHAICNGCGMDLTEGAREYGISYGLFHMKHCRGDGVTPCPETLGECGEYHYEQVKVATGTKKVITGYKCSTCGATKGA